MNNKLKIIQSLTFSDFFVAIYTYLSIVKFDEFKKILLTLGPDFSIEFAMNIYQIFLQSIIFTGLLAIIFHLIVYYFYFKDKKFAKIYIKFYSIVAAIFLFLGVIFANQYLLLIPMALYLYAFKKIISKTVE